MFHLLSMIDLSTLIKCCLILGYYNEKIRHQAEGLARCFVLLSVDLGTEILSSDTILSALTTCGRPYGAPLDFERIYSLSMCRK